MTHAGAPAHGLAHGAVGDRARPPGGDPGGRLARARALVAAVPDPEIPAVTLADLGIVRDVREEAGRVVVELTPTYTGCPATAVIRQDVADALAAGGVTDADVRVTLAQAWSTDWITEDGRRKLRDYGIAPPARSCAAQTRDGASAGALTPTTTAGRCAGAGTPTAASIVRWLPSREDPLPACPRCGSGDTARVSEHGSTPCKALYRCVACLEPFDYFKPY